MPDPYHIHLPKWPKFSWTEEEKSLLPASFKDRLEKIDGDVPTTRISSWREFHELVEDRRFVENGFIFRGHHQPAWDLIPSIARGMKNGIYTPKQAKACLESFRRASRGRKELDPNLHDDLEMWALGQHYGLRTPLLDWTMSPYVALFFAFEKADGDDDPDDSRVVFALNKDRVETKIEELQREGYKDDQLVRIFQPSGDTNRRLLSQAGLFLAVPPNQSVTGWILNHLLDEEGSDDSIANSIMKIHIPNKERVECLRSLHRMNIHHASLFPDLIGSSAYTNFEIDVYNKYDLLTLGQEGAQ